MNRDLALVRVLLNDRDARTRGGWHPVGGPAGSALPLLVLSTLLSTRIRACVAVAAARELFAAGCRTHRAHSH